MVFRHYDHLPVVAARAALAIVLLASCTSALPPIGRSAIPGTASPCADAGQYFPASTASYPPGVLEGQQSSLSQGVGFDRVRPEQAAAEYLAAAGLANSTNAAEVRTVAQNSDEATAIACLRDGTRIRVTLYHPFPSDPQPIWAVRDYQRSR